MSLQDKIDAMENDPEFLKEQLKLANSEFEYVNKRIKELEAELRKMPALIAAQNARLSIERDRLEAEVAAEKKMTDYQHEAWLAMCTKWGEKDAEVRQLMNEVVLQTKCAEANRQTREEFEAANRQLEAEVANLELDKGFFKALSEELREKAELWDMANKMTKQDTPFVMLPWQFLQQVEAAVKSAQEGEKI